MVEFSIRELIAPSTDEIEAVTVVARAAFENDPIMQFISDGHQDRAVGLHRAMVISGSMAGLIHVAEVEDEGTKTVVGASVSFPPGRRSFDSQDQIDASLTPLLSILSDEIVKWWSDYYFPEHAAYSKSLASEQETANSWYIQTLCVSPLYQKKGIGKALYGEVLKKAQATNSLVRLQTQSDENVSVYESPAFGMHVIGRKEFVDTNGGSFLFTWMST